MAEAARPIRVAIDATPLIGRPTGVGSFVGGLLGGLATRRDVWPLAFAVSWRRRGAIRERVPDGVAIARRAMPARPLHLAWRRAGLPPVEWFVGPVDVVHGTNYVVPPARRARRVVSVHDVTTVRFPEMCTPATLAFPDLIRRAVARGAWVHTLSDFVASEVVELFGAEPTRVRTVHLGIPPLAAPDPGASARFLPEGAERYVLAIGTAEPRKDLPGLVAAFDRVVAQGGAARRDLALVLAGPEGWGSDDLSAAIGSARARDRIVRTGWVDDAALAGLLEGAVLLAYPSRYEGFGFPPLQAMAHGVPVVATRAGAIEEVLGDAAELVDLGDVDALADAIARVVDDDDRRRDLVVRGTARAGRYGWDRCADGMADLYRDALAT